MSALLAMVRISQSQDSGELTFSRGLIGTRLSHACTYLTIPGSPG